MEPFSKQRFYTLVLYFHFNMERVMMGKKIVVIIVILRMLVIVKNIFIFIIHIVTMRIRRRWQIMMGFTTCLQIHFQKQLQIANKVRNVKEPNLEAKRFYEILYVVNQPTYSSCREDLSKFLPAARIVQIKIDHSLLELHGCMGIVI